MVVCPARYRSGLLGVLGRSGKASPLYQGNIVIQAMTGLK